MVASEAYSQKSNFSLKISNTTVEKVLDEIEKQSDYVFLYSNEMLDLKKSIDLDVNNKDIFGLLEEVFDKQAVKFTVIENKIILSSNLSQSAIQNNIIITGKVTDINGDALPGVNVYEKENPQNGVITGVDGTFSIEVDSGDDAILFSFIGFEDQEIIAGTSREVNVVLMEEATGLDEVVVTALGIKREKKALGYAVQEVGADELNTTQDPSVANALQGKVAGVVISKGAGGAGSSSKITIRGNSSLAGNNNPLWIVDGIPLQDNQPGKGSEWGGIDIASTVDDINPDNIESITVLKGANAAALYGSRAGNGVIVVTTKKGIAREGIGVSYNGSVVVDKIKDLNDYQTTYSQGTGGEFSPYAQGSWGEKITGQTVDNWREGYDSYQLKANTDHLDDFFRTGVTQTHNVALYGGNEKMTARVNFGYNKTDGVYEKLKLEKYDFTASINGKLNDIFSIDFKANFINYFGENRPENGVMGPTSHFAIMPLTIRTEDIIDPIDAEGNHVNYLGPTDNLRNPYFMQYQRNNNDERTRFLGNIGVTAKLTNKLSARLMHGLDFYTYTWEQRRLLDSASADKGGYKNNKNIVSEQNTEFTLRYNNRFNDFDLNVTVGANRMAKFTERNKNSSGQLIIPGSYFYDNGTNLTASVGYSEKEIQSVFGLASIGYKNAVYLDVTARNDWSSTLPEENRSYFYPSINTSLLLHEIFDFPKSITFAKIRGGWSQVGKDTDPYELANNYKIGRRYENTAYARVPSTLALYDLKPEIVTSTEVGLDLKMFQNRFGLDFTYYDSESKNQILEVPTPQSSGYSAERINAGSITNEGYEIMLYGVPVKTRDFNWDITLNLAHNKSMVNELHDIVKTTDFGGMGIANVWAIEGEEYGQIVASKTWQRDDEGNILVSEDGQPLTLSNESKVIGNINPDLTGSIRNSFKYKKLDFSALINFQFGGDIISSYEAILSQNGNSKRTEKRDNFIVDGVHEDGSKNSTPISAESYYSNYGGMYGVAEDYLYDASYIKLQEVSVGYTFSESLFAKVNWIHKIRLSAVGRNLAYLQRDTPNAPDMHYTSDVAAQAFDYAGIPFTRSYGFNLSVEF
jgi:TonB-linked SusC/RagA family outer membrane protein